MTSSAIDFIPVFQRFGIHLARGMLVLIVILAVFGLAVDADCLATNWVSENNCEAGSTNSFSPIGLADSGCALCCLEIPVSNGFFFPKSLPNLPTRQTIDGLSIPIIPLVPPPNFA